MAKDSTHFIRAQAEPGAGKSDLAKHRQGLFAQAPHTQASLQGPR